MLRQNKTMKGKGIDEFFWLSFVFQVIQRPYKLPQSQKSSIKLTQHKLYLSICNMNVPHVTYTLWHGDMLA